MTEPLPIIELGNPILHQPAVQVEDFGDEHLQTLIDALLVTVHQSNGVGIAAPQVGVSCRLFIVASRPNLRYPHAPKMEPTVMINPTILNHSEQRIAGWEGCLSVPGLRGFIQRYHEIEVAYTDRAGRQHCQVLTDFVARIFQHELDHLDGKVFLDRIDNTQALMSEREFQQQFGG